MENITLRCPDGYQLTCMKDSDEDRCCCVHVVSPIRSSQTADLVSSP
jgi:hypothetical protein